MINKHGLSLTHSYMHRNEVKMLWCVWWDFFAWQKTNKCMSIPINMIYSAQSVVNMVLIVLQNHKFIKWGKTGLGWRWHKIFQIIYILIFSRNSDDVWPQDEHNKSEVLSKAICRDTNVSIRTGVVFSSGSITDMLYTVSLWFVCIPASFSSLSFKLKVKGTKAFPARRGREQQLQRLRLE